MILCFSFPTSGKKIQAQDCTYNLTDSHFLGDFNKQQTVLQCGKYIAGTQGPMLDYWNIHTYVNKELSSIKGML